MKTRMKTPWVESPMYYLPNMSANDLSGKNQVFFGDEVTSISELEREAEKTRQYLHRLESKLQR